MNILKNLNTCNTCIVNINLLFDRKGHARKTRGQCPNIRVCRERVIEKSIGGAFILGLKIQTLKSCIIIAKG